MAFKAQLLNFRFEFMDLNRHIFVDRHLIVPVSLPICSKENCLKLLSIALTSCEESTSRVNCLVNAHGLSPDVKLTADFYSEYKDLWIYNRELSASQYKKLSFKNIDVITILSEQSQCQHSAILVDDNLVTLLSNELQKHCHWHLVLDGDEIQIVANDNFLKGKVNKQFFGGAIRTKTVAPHSCSA